MIASGSRALLGCTCGSRIFRASANSGDRRLTASAANRWFRSLRYKVPSCVRTALSRMAFLPAFDISFSSELTEDNDVSCVDKSARSDNRRRDPCSDPRAGRALLHGIDVTYRRNAGRLTLPRSCATRILLSRVSPAR